MKGYLVKMFGISLGLTMVVELVVAFVVRLGIKGRMHRGMKTEQTSDGGRHGVSGVKDAFDHGSRDRPSLGSKRHMALLVVLVNVLTNPLAVLFCWLGRMWLPPFLSLPLELAVEAAVVAVEAWIYRSFMEKPGWGTGRPLLLSVATNVCSWTAGVVFGGWIDLVVTFFGRMIQAY